MFCMYCGAELPENAGFCPACGKRVTARGIVGSAPAPEIRRETAVGPMTEAPRHSVGEKVESFLSRKVTAYWAWLFAISGFIGFIAFTLFTDLFYIQLTKTNGVWRVFPHSLLHITILAIAANLTDLPDLPKMEKPERKKKWIMLAVSIAAALLVAGAIYFFSPLQMFKRAVSDLDYKAANFAYQSMTEKEQEEAARWATEKAANLLAGMF